VSDNITRQRWVLVLTSIASFMVGLDVLVVTTALTTIRQQLGASLSELDWIVSAYTLSFAVLLMTAAALGDRYGRRRLLIGGLGLFTVASVACALVPGIGWLVAARAVQRAGSAMILPHTVSLLSAAYPPQRRARALGIFSGVVGLAILSGPMLGGAIVQGLDWRWIFWLNVPIGRLPARSATVLPPPAMGVGAGLLAAAAVIGLAIPGRRTRPAVARTGRQAGAGERVAAAAVRSSDGS
jgi:MFS family permease